MATMTEPLPNLALRVKQLREAAGLSQQALAMAAGLSISVVTQIEQGARADPRLSTAVALARALKVSVDVLIEPAGPRPADAPAGGQAGPPSEKPAPRKRPGKGRGKKGAGLTPPTTT